MRIRRRHPVSYGFGWQLDSINGRRLVHHGGCGPGARAMFARFVDDRLTVIVLINLDDVDIQSITTAVAGFYLQRPGPSANRYASGPRESLV